MQRIEVQKWGAIALILGVASIVLAWVLWVSNDVRNLAKETDKTLAEMQPIPKKEPPKPIEVLNEKKRPFLTPPPPPDMERMKKEGCIADGLLSGYGKKEERMAKYINRSDCYYLHRAIETWLEPPDWKEIDKVKKQIKKKDIVYGMFIAEAIDKKADYSFEEENRDFEFSEMCRDGSNNFWGEHTCKPSFEKSEYRKYLRAITREAMDRGVQSFLFGQIFYQESAGLKRYWVRDVIADMHAYADWLGMKIVIGAQTNDIEDERYLRLFDYIEGGVGINDDGDFPKDDACHPRWYQEEGDWCWALLWNDRYAKKAKNVLLHLDWSGKKNDDMARFSRMNRSKRKQTLENLYEYFTSRGHGFLLPVLARLHGDNGGCYGPTTHFYAPNDEFECKDEEILENILKNKK